MYGLELFLGGTKYSVFFFSTFIGNFQPFTPHQPIDIDEAYAQDRKTFYLAWYKEDEKSRKLYFLEKYWLSSTAVAAPEQVKSIAGYYYFSVGNTAAGMVIGDEIKKQNTLVKDVFYTYAIDKAGRMLGSRIVTKRLMDRYSYTYRETGALADVKTEVFDIPDVD